jgi:hypothetical protein
MLFRARHDNSSEDIPMFANDNERQMQFKKWLRRTKHCSAKTAGDANGGAKLAEGILGESLDESVSRGLSAAQIVDRLISRLLPAQKSTGNAERVGRELGSSVRLYLEFCRAP